MAEVYVSVHRSARKFCVDAVNEKYRMSTSWQSTRSSKFNTSTTA